MKTYQFPQQFFFGVGDADLQVMGEQYTRNEEQAEETMWHAYARTSPRVYNNHTPDEGVDRYHLWKNDVALMQKLGIQNYRTSISMARILHKDQTINSAAVTWYKNYFKALRKAGIHIYATLYHWELPQYLNEQGGWVNSATIPYLVRHAKAVTENLGEYIDEYFLVNEPRCASLVSYYYGEHAPGEKNLAHALQAAHNLMLAQGLMFQELKAIDTSMKLSAVINVGARYAIDATDKNIQAAKRVDQFKNKWFLDPLYLGRYPEELVAYFGKKMPMVTKGDMEIIKIGDKLHTLGLNYYRGDLVTFDPKDELHVKTMINDKGLKTDLGWGIYIPPHYQEGLYDILQQVYFSYKDHGLKQIYITENGIALKTPWDGKARVINDDRRIFFLQKHIEQIYKALLLGIPVKGYFTWTLMDNFEWAQGYRPESCFGLIHVDRKTMKRIWKKSAYWYKKLIKTHSLSA